MSSVTFPEELKVTDIVSVYKKYFGKILSQKLFDFRQEYTSQDAILNLLKN